MDKTLWERWKPLAVRAAEAAAEVVWPTRCALCDTPGAVLCERCLFGLPYLDWWRACPRCGSAYGRVQCDLCNPVAMGRLGLDGLPFERCASATMFGSAPGRIVRVYKDMGEQRLAGDMAQAMARALPPGWLFDAVTYVPATKVAARYRGFDHGELLARELSALVCKPCEPTLGRPRTRDQRKLGAAQRIANLADGFSLAPEAVSGRRYLLVDDVFTTGATLCAASKALVRAGAAKPYCATFARV